MNGVKRLEPGSHLQADGQWRVSNGAVRAGLGSWYSRYAWCALSVLVGLAGGCAGETGEETSPLELSPKCESGSRIACSSVITSEGLEVQLGERGSIMDPNMGEGFETVIASGDSDNNAACTAFAGLFGQDADQTAQLLDTMDLDMGLYTVYRPANFEPDEKLPVITWGNGTCAQPEGYGPLLRYVASQGFIVIAANSRWVGSNAAMTVALDYIFAANDDPSSPYFGRVDTEQVGAMGHSQGAGATATAANDARVKTVILFNGRGVASKPFLTISGDRDLGNPTAMSMGAAVDGAPEGAFVFFHKVPMNGSFDGHLTLMTEPTRVTELTARWFEYMLKGDQDARAWFVGDDCTLCGRDEDFEYGSNGLK